MVVLIIVMVDRIKAVQSALAGLCSIHTPITSLTLSRDGKLPPSGVPDVM